MRKHFRYFLLLLAITFCSENVFAQTNRYVSGSLTYQYVSGRTYNFTLTLYREAGGPLPQDVPIIAFYSPSNSLPVSAPDGFNVSGGSWTAVAVPGCEQHNFNLEKRVYTGSIDLSTHNGGYSPANDWVFFFQDAYTTTAINTANIGASTNFYVEAALNDLNGNVSSPSFANDPVFAYCATQSKTLDLGVSASALSLSYSLVSPETNKNGSTITYNSGYSATRPISILGPITVSGGVITVSSSSSSDVGNIGFTDVLIQFSQGANFMGSVRRPVVIEVIDCPDNDPPVITSTSVSTISDPCDLTEQITITVEGNDPDGDAISIAGFSEIITDQRWEKTYDVMDYNTGSYSVTVTLTEGGCNPLSDQATINYTIPSVSSPYADFEWDNVCKGDITDFSDLSSRDYPSATNDNTINFVQWQWIIDGRTSVASDDNFTLTGASGDFSRAFADTGTYDVRLIVTDENGCKDTSDHVVYNVQPPTPPSMGFEFVDSCAWPGVIFQDTSVYYNNSNVDETYWEWGDMNLSTTSGPGSTSACFVYEEFELMGDARDTMSFVIRMTMSAKEAGHISCPSEDTITIRHIINPNPSVGFLDIAYMMDCNNRDTAFSVEDSLKEYTPYDVDSLGHDTISVIWYWYSRDDAYGIPVCSEGSTGTEPFLGGSPGTALGDADGSDTSIVIDANDPMHVGRQGGIYSVIVTDIVGCMNSDSILIDYPVEAEFEYTPYCDTGDAMVFYDISSMDNPLMSRTWNFGDGNTASGDPQNHTYGSHGEYRVSLYVVDNTLCDDSIWEDPVYNLFVDTTDFSALPIDPCVGDPVEVIGVYDHADSSHFISRDWTFPSGFSASASPYQDTVNGSLSSEGTKVFSLEYEYNTTQKVRAGDECIRTIERTIFVDPEFSVSLVPSSKACTGEEITYYLSRSGTIPSSSIVWVDWFHSYDGGAGLDTIYSSDSSMVDTTGLDSTFYFPDNSTYRIQYHAIDSLGCESSGYELVTTNEIPKIFIIQDDTSCIGNELTLSLGGKDSLAAGKTYMGLFIFNAGDSIEKPINQFDEIGLSFDQGGKQDVTIINFEGTQADKTQFCFKTFIDSVYVFHPPVIGYTADTVCEGTPTQFTNTSYIHPADAAFAEIIYYEWSMNDDGGGRYTKHPSYTYSSFGNYLPTLIVKTNHACESQGEGDTVVVLRNPVADFKISGEFDEDFTKVQFEDNSSTGPNQGLISSYYDFGDGTIDTMDFDPEHTYDAIDKYYVTHAIMNDSGCTDTIVKLSNLIAYLELPTAFSPNGDGNNDGLRLIYNAGIKELKEFRIYNRWGELVFDAGVDLSSTWDGTYKGKDQEFGVYVAYVSGLSVYNDEIKFKANVTLLR